MGFNLGSFAAGALKTLSENVKEQSDTQDADAKRYLEAGIAEGKAATKAYRAENKTLKELGSQLDAQGFTNNQIKLVLKGGKASTQNFIKAVSDAKSLGDPTTDVASWVNVSGKPSSASWEDYITTVIQGRPDKDAAESYYIAPKNTSILGSYLNNGSIATGNGNSRYDQQAAKMSAGMGINVKDVVAAGTGNMVYDDANQVSGTIQTKDLQQSLAFSEAKKSSKYLSDTRPTNLKLLKLQLAAATFDEERDQINAKILLEEDKVRRIKAEHDLVVTEWKLDNNATITQLKAQVANAEKTVQMINVPDDYKSGIMLFQHKYTEEEKKGDAADPEKLEFYQSKVDQYKLQYVDLTSVISNAGQRQSISSLTNVFDSMFQDELIKLQGTDNSNYKLVQTLDGGQKPVFVGKRSDAARQTYLLARSNATARYLIATEGMSGGSYTMMLAVIDAQEAAAVRENESFDASNGESLETYDDEKRDLTLNAPPVPKVASFNSSMFSSGRVVDKGTANKMLTGGLSVPFRNNKEKLSDIDPDQSYIIQITDSTGVLKFRELSGKQLLDSLSANPTTGIMSQKKSSAR